MAKKAKRTKKMGKPAKKMKSKARKPSKKASAKRGKAMKKAKAKITAKKPKKVEESAAIAEKPAGKVVGTITHYFDHISVAVVALSDSLSLGDKIRIKGHTTDITQTVDSMQMNHQDLTTATKGMEIGMKVKGKVREHDIVYKL
jgi:putative protease